MPNNSDAKSPSHSREAKAHRNWWHKAKHFLISNCGIYDMGDNGSLNISGNHINASVVVIAERLISSISRVNEEETQEPGQQSECPDIPVAGQDTGSTGEEPTILPVCSPVQTNNDLSASPDSHDGSEVTADYADPDVLSRSSKAYSRTSRARPHIYSLEMLTHGAGYPLYMPTPPRGPPPAYRKKGVRVGDVGVITANGAFDFLFNACQHEDRSEGVNPVTLPNGFELLKPLMRINDKFDHGECLPSDHVKVSDHDPHFFQCSAAEGAILALPEGATLYEAMNIRHFERHAARHASSWYEYALNEGRDISNGSLYFVTECIKSKSWGIAVFYGDTTTTDDLHAIFSEGSCRWERRGKVEAKTGPKPKDMVLSDDDEPNQCIFLRGFKIMLQPGLWDKLKSATTVALGSSSGSSSSLPSAKTASHSPSHEMPSGQADLNNQSPNNFHSATGSIFQTAPTRVVNGPGLQIEAILEESCGEMAPLHPSDLINIMILSLKPEASVALVHDSTDKLGPPQDFMTDPVNPDVEGLLENVKRSYKAVMDQSGIVVLEKPSLDDDSSLMGDAAKSLLSNPTSPNLNGVPVYYWSESSFGVHETLYDKDGENEFSVGSGMMPGGTGYLAGYQSWSRPVSTRDEFEPWWETYDPVEDSELYELEKETQPVMDKSNKQDEQRSRRQRASHYPQEINGKCLRCASFSNSPICERSDDPFDLKCKKCRRDKQSCSFATYGEVRRIINRGKAVEESEEETSESSGQEANRSKANKEPWKKSSRTDRRKNTREHINVSETPEEDGASMEAKNEQGKITTANEKDRTGGKEGNIRGREQKRSYETVQEKKRKKDTEFNDENDQIKKKAKSPGWSSHGKTLRLMAHSRGSSPIDHTTRGPASGTLGSTSPVITEFPVSPAFVQGVVDHGVQERDRTILTRAPSQPVPMEVDQNRSLAQIERELSAAENKASTYRTLAATVLKDAETVEEAVDKLKEEFIAAIRNDVRRDSRPGKEGFEMLDDPRGYAA